MYFTLFHAMLCYSVRNAICYTILYYTMLYYTILYYTILCYAMLCYGMLCYAMLCYAMLCYAMLCYAMLCYAILCYLHVARFLVNLISHLFTSIFSPLNAQSNMQPHFYLLMLRLTILIICVFIVTLRSISGPLIHHIVYDFIFNFLSVI